MKVVHVIEALGGGVYTYFKDLTNFFEHQTQATDLETYVVYSGKRKEINPEHIRRDFSKKAVLIELDMERELSPIKDLQATWKLRKIFQEINPDVIHLHSSKAGVLGRWAHFLLFSRKKLFYTPHGYAFLRQDISKRKRKLYYQIEKLTQSLFGGTTIACGDTEYEIAKKIGKAVLVRNGVDFNILEPYYSAPKNKRLTIGTIGRIMAQKNPKLFNAIALLHPEYDFIWIGDGEDRALLTAPNIAISGWFTNNLELLPTLNALDVYLQTSLWEGLPIAVLEAMALRKPIIATNVIGNKDIVVPEISGFLFDEAAELAAIFEKLEEPSFRCQMGQQAYLQSKRDFDKNLNFQKLYPIYSR